MFYYYWKIAVLQLAIFFIFLSFSSDQIPVLVMCHIVPQHFGYHEHPLPNYLMHFDQIEYRLTKIWIEVTAFSTCLLQCRKNAKKED
jgi:hypothetical protein